MKRILIFLISLFFAQFFILNTSVYAQDSTKVKQGKGQKRIPFVDKNGDGYNDLLPDHDGDGIPDAMDPDWHKKHQNKNRHRFIDLDGDGINDLIFSGKAREDKPGSMDMRHSKKWKDRSGPMGEEGGNMRDHNLGGKGKGKGHR